MPPVRSWGRSEENSPKIVCSSVLSVKGKAPEGGASDAALRGFTDAQI